MFASDTELSSQKNGKLTNVDYSGRTTLRMNFQGSTYKSCTLELIDARWSFLGGVRFEECTLGGADFEFCLLNGSTLDGVSVAPTIFHDCGELRGVNFSNVDLTGVQFTGTTSLMNAYFNIHTTGLSDAQKTQMLNITIKNRDGSIHPLAQGRQLTLQNIQKKKWMVEQNGNYSLHYLNVLERVDLTNANLRRLDLQMKSFAGSNLTGVDFSDTSLDGADFSNAMLKNIYFNGNKRLGMTNFTNAHLIDTDLSGVNFSGANFTHSTISGVSTDSNFYTDALHNTMTTFIDVNFHEANIDNSRFRMTLFQNANFAGATIADDVNNNIHPQPANGNEALKNANAFMSNDLRRARFNSASNWIVWNNRAVPQLMASLNNKGIVDIGNKNE
jgi:uncharacterized protein YjbI with pentapeptide repeats